MLDSVAPNVVVSREASIVKRNAAAFSALALIARHYRIPADPAQLAHEAGLGRNQLTSEDLVRSARRIGLKARVFTRQAANRLRYIPLPAILVLGDGDYVILSGRLEQGRLRILDPLTRGVRDVDPPELDWTGEFILVARRLGGPGVNPKAFSFLWFIPSIWRYRAALFNVLVASVFIQLFALVTPLFFQIIIDRVLVHKGTSTLVVLIAGLAGIGIFDVTLQFLRSYMLNHTTSRIDVELGSRLFDHLIRLPLSYFETRPAGQTVARVREIETIRSFLTGQGLSSVIDLLFIFVFIFVLYLYSASLTLIVLLSIPCYVAAALFMRPLLRERIREKFAAGAYSQQFLVESIFGIQTLKAAAIEPILRNDWEERLSAYVKKSFQAVTLAAAGQNTIQYISKATTALILFFGAKAVMDGDLTVGALVAFNMIMNQAIQPIIRLSQLWQDFQQVYVSVERVGDILNSPLEGQRFSNNTLPPAKGAIDFSDITFRYQPDAPAVLERFNLAIPASQVLGIVGPSGSGKSTLTKLIQRFYTAEKGQIFIDGLDIGQVDPAWLRTQIGIVLQENTLFNRTIHENIALARPAMTRAQVIGLARLAGADEFITKLPLGYDTPIVERGLNLSGGQRQRIAIARALATNPKVLILDEATSALDYESERIIQQNMQQIVQGRTVIIIAHRLAAVRNCDRIIALDRGRIVDDGTHSELLLRPGSMYRHLWMMQMEGTRG